MFFVYSITIKKHFRRHHCATLIGRGQGYIVHINSKNFCYLHHLFSFSRAPSIRKNELFGKYLYTYLIKLKIVSAPHKCGCL
jgi:hypothetical protein